MTDTTKTTSTFRMHFPRDRYNTLDGYVFANREHARQWFMMNRVDRSNITLEPVEIGEMRPCRRCGGSGFHQSVKTTSDRISAIKFLEDATSDVQV